MVELSTEYLGLRLKNPLVPSSSPLCKDLDSARRLEDAGASALILHSMFEEKIEEEDAHVDRFLHQQGLGHGEADSFHPMPTNYVSYEEQYLDHLCVLKDALDIPVIASLNGTSAGGWVSYAAALEEAGADALELNVYYIPAGAHESSSDVEGRYAAIMQSLGDQVTIPVTMKLSSQFSSVVHVARQLQEAGARGLSLFNRFYQPDIDLDTLEVVPRIALSTSQESLLRIRWVAILRSQVDCSLAVTGGIHTVQDVLKALLAGADVTHMCSALLRNGPDHLATVLSQLSSWLEEHEYVSVQQLKGSVSHGAADEASAFFRANYVEVLDSYDRPAGVRW